MIFSVPQKDYSFVREKLLNKEEIALLDVREEDPHAQCHPLFAANFPLSRLEVDAFSKLPRTDVPIVTFDNGEAEAELAAKRLMELGYTDVSVFKDGLQGWIQSGGEVFKDVNVPSKSFGELVESKRHTPSLSAQEVKQLIDDNEDIVVVDVRRFDEYQTMSIPKGISVPGAELVMRVPELAPSPSTKIIVNCAGRTRSIIGTQSLINAGIPNEVHALRNGTIGWTLAGQTLDRGQSRKFQDVSESTKLTALDRSRNVAQRAGVKRASLMDVVKWQTQIGRTTYFFDTRTPEEYEAGHLPGFRSTPGGQLVQETEMVAPVRGARIVLCDPDGVRANMTASWLAQMAWDVYVLDEITPAQLSEYGSWQPVMPAMPTVKIMTRKELQEHQDCLVLDLSTHAQYVKNHIAGAWYILRSRIKQDAQHLPSGKRYVLTANQIALAYFAYEDFQEVLGEDVYVLEGGNNAWFLNQLPSEQGASHLASDPIDRYKRPYEGTNVSHQAMQAYLDWEFGLVEQLGRDGTHHFWVL